MANLAQKVSGKKLHAKSTGESPERKDPYEQSENGTKTTVQQGLFRTFSGRTELVFQGLILGAVCIVGMASASAIPVLLHNHAQCA